MKILIDGRFYGLENAGIGRYVKNLVGVLSESAKDLDFVIILNSKYFTQLKLPSNWKKVCCDIKHYSLEEQLKIPSILNKENPDLVHFPHFNVPILYRKPYVITIHDMLWHRQRGFQVTTLPIFTYIFKYLGYKLVFGNTVSLAKKIFVPSEYVKKEIVTYYNIPEDKIVVGYEGVDVSLTKKAGKSYSPLPKSYFLYLGSCYPHKNIERALAATHLLREETKKDIKLLLISARNVFLKRLVKYAKSKGYEESLQVLGFVEDEYLAGIVKGSLGFVFPSLSEGFGLPGLEAMSIGTPVAASDIPVFKEVYKDNALYFDPNDVSSIKDAMKRILDMSVDEREAVVNRGRRYSKNFSWEKMVRLVVTSYRNMKIRSN